MIRYLVSDLDGTLLHGHGESILDLSEVNKEGIKRAKEHGIHIIPATGRSVTYPIKLYEMYHFSDDIWGAGLNGAAVYHNGMIQEHGIPASEIKELLAFVEPLIKYYDNIQLQDLWDKRIYYTNQKEPYFRMVKESKVLGCSSTSELEIKEYLQEYPDTNFGKFSLISYDPTYNIELEKIITSRFGEKYTITRSNPTYLEITNQRASKGTFIQCLIEHGIKREEIAVIGDSYNDASMFSEVIHSFALSHGEEYVKNHAAHVVDSVAEAIDWIIAYNKKGNE
ncbi:MAG: HAD-IIB family hydrolase [Erysipelotrichaceae bacterium]|nr:HAD-IIB family hydrolase [Erysipelotrichaceae bacterium]MBR3693817.1 HAD-IIB family hydrolase [Erysipelotrichales bacterium]